MSDGGCSTGCGCLMLISLAVLAIVFAICGAAIEMPVVVRIFVELVAAAFACADGILIGYGWAKS